MKIYWPKDWDIDTTSGRLTSDDEEIFRKANPESTLMIKKRSDSNIRVVGIEGLDR